LEGGVVPAPRSESLIDKVDAADRPIGAIQRSNVFAEAVNFRVVHIFVFDDDGSLLLQQLSPKRERHPGRWGSSVAGYLHAGETYWAGARRRLQEELGLSVPLSKHGSTWMLDEGCRKFINLYLARSNSADIREPHHISALQFWSLDFIEARLRSGPEVFTETFRYLFAFFRATTQL
jgi:isopentenyl-diphosphate delta-isomerase